MKKSVFAQISETICTMTNDKVKLILSDVNNLIRETERRVLDANIAMAQVRDNMLTEAELIVQLDVYTEFGR